MGGKEGREIFEILQFETLFFIRIHEESQREKFSSPTQVGKQRRQKILQKKYTKNKQKQDKPNERKKEAPSTTDNIRHH